MKNVYRQSMDNLAQPRAGVGSVAWEVTKFAGVIAWIVGLATMNLVILAVALFITVASITHTRRVRHQELLDAVTKG